MVASSAIVQASDRINSSWPWYVTRASGLVAAVLLLLLMISGVSLITGQHYKFMEPLKAWANHRVLGISFALATLVHVLSLLFDKFITFKLSDVFLPFASSYKPVQLGGLHLGSFGVAAGILAFYLMAIIVITSLTIIDKSPLVWRLFHFLSYLVMASIFIHALLIGSDIKNLIIRVLWWLTAILVVGFSLQRLFRRTKL